ncbi:MAG: hypothetical protein EGP69_03870 [[Ruminococcus] faecis]|nr:hypothetical protein [Mediterraneibacter faecis]
MKNKEKVLRALILFSENPVVERKGGIQVMSTYKSLTYDDRKNIEKMCKCGASSQEIADAIDKTYPTIYRELRRCPLGKYSAYEAQMDADSKKRKRYGDGINTSKGKWFTYEDRIEIEHMIKEGQNVWEIAEYFGKSDLSVRREIKRCSGEYSAEEAQKDALKAKENQQAAKKKVMKTRMENKEKEYKRIIRTCLKINPQADMLDVKVATGFPIERVEKYYDEIHEEILKK